jgi:general secretion pathway protein I
MMMSKLPSSVQRTKGFTLIEVMVALLVVAIALAANLNSINAHTQLYYQLEKRYWGQMVAWNQMINYLYPGKQGSSGKSGNSEMRGATWYWKISQAEIELPISLPFPLHRVDITVSNKSNFSTLASNLVSISTEKK